MKVPGDILIAHLAQFNQSGLEGRLPILTAWMAPQGCTPPRPPLQFFIGFLYRLSGVVISNLRLLLTLKHSVHVLVFTHLKTLG